MVTKSLFSIPYKFNVCFSFVFYILNEYYYIYMTIYVLIYIYIQRSIMKIVFSKKYVYIYKHIITIV